MRARNVALLEADHTGTMYIWSLVPELAAITGLEGPELSGYMLRINLLLIQKTPLLIFRMRFELLGHIGFSRRASWQT